MLHFSALRNEEFQLCLQENSNVITNILVDLPATMKGQKPGAGRFGLMREY
jgi:hypothetical protein